LTHIQFYFKLFCEDGYQIRLPLVRWRWIPIYLVIPS